MKRVWVTRASPGAEETAARLLGLGFEPVVAPLLRVQAVAGGPLDLTGVAALAFTSANGVAAYSDRCAERALPVFAVGAATARAARARGFASVVSADGDVATLARTIVAQGPLSGVVLHPGAAELAGNLSGDLAARGVPARTVAVYETVAQALDIGAADWTSDLDGVLLHSPKAARLLADFLARHPAAPLTAVCISPAAAEPLSSTGLANVAVARAPTEEALFIRLTEVLPQ